MRSAMRGDAGRAAGVTVMPGSSAGRSVSALMTSSHSVSTSRRRPSTLGENCLHVGEVHLQKRILYNKISWFAALRPIGSIVKRNQALSGPVHVPPLKR
jgi:hypothetical protein